MYCLRYTCRLLGLGVMGCPTEHAKVQCTQEAVCSVPNWRRNVAWNKQLWFDVHNSKLIQSSKEVDDPEQQTSGQIKECWTDQ